MSAEDPAIANPCGRGRSRQMRIAHRPLRSGTLGKGAALAIAAATASAAHAQVAITGIVDFAGAETVQLRGIANDGSAVGYRIVGGVAESFIRTSAGDTFFQNSGASTLAIGINDLGETVGSSASTAGSDAFIRDPGGAFTTFNPAGNPDVSAVGINNAGVIVGAANAGNEAFRRDADGTVTTFAYPGQAGDLVLNSNATDVRNDGAIIGHSLLFIGANLGARGWISTDDGATFTDIISPDFDLTFAWGGNDTGLIVGDVSSSQTLETRTGFVLDTATNSYTYFDIAGADWTVPTGINDAGDIVGFWRDADDGTIRGFTAFIPSPGTVPVLALGALLAARRRK